MTTRAGGCWDYNQSIGKYGASVSLRLRSAGTPFSFRFWSSVKEVTSSGKLAYIFGKYSRHRVNAAGLVPEQTRLLDGNGHKGWYHRQGVWGRNGDSDTKARRRTHLHLSSGTGRRASVSVPCVLDLPPLSLLVLDAELLEVDFTAATGSGVWGETSVMRVSTVGNRKTVDSTETGGVGAESFTAVVGATTKVSVTDSCRGDDRMTREDEHRGGIPVRGCGEGEEETATVIRGVRVVGKILKSYGERR
ncbi:hypothetical protein ElyMa_001734500 [Elysia marginata]|uniref:Uncharacterized protein n=1 Tax=Elysia marginata TaxID=1093978 RepID=A0AAV4JVY5_9GAST|nr:hypothetical protein ElyMa_001734500 [Elysia marginata]